MQEELEKDQWWVTIPDKESQILEAVFHVLTSKHKPTNPDNWKGDVPDFAVQIEVWDKDGSKRVKEVPLNPKDLKEFQLVTKAEAIAKLL